MSRRRSLPLVVLALVVLVLGASASLKAAEADLRLFRPAVGPDAIVTVRTSRTLSHLDHAYRLTTDYGHDLLVGDAGRLGTLEAVEHRATVELGAALGLFGWVDIELSLPFHFLQKGDVVRHLTASSPVFGLGDLAATAKGMLLDRRAHGGFGLALAVTVTAPTGRRDALMTADGVTARPIFIADYEPAEGYVLALEVGYLVRPMTTLADLTLDDAVHLALGGEARLGFEDLSVLAEARADVDVLHGIDERSTPVSLLGALRWRGPYGLALTLGAEGGLTTGAGAADVRAFASLGWSPRELPDRPGEPPPELSPTTSPEELPPGLEPATFGPVQEPVDPDEASAQLLATLAASDSDTDGDGVPLPIDQCPDEPEDADAFEDDDGCPELDNDHDGVPDEFDQCADAAEVINGVDDDDGCPDEGAGLVAVSDERIELSDRVYFRTGSDELSPASVSLLSQVASVLKARFDIRRVRIEGHTDDRGDPEMNVDLSERRARRVRAFLVARGVEPWRLDAKGFGGAYPIGPNETARQRQRNRRVEFHIVERLDGGGAP